MEIPSKSYFYCKLYTIFKLITNFIKIHVKSVHRMDHFYVYYLLLEFITYIAVIQSYTTKR